MFVKKFLATVSLILVLTMLLMAGCGSDNKPETTTAEQTNEAVTEAVQASTDDTTVYENISEEISSEPEIATEKTSLTEEEESSAAEETTTAVQLQTVEEIVAYFNKCANRIKPEAKTVTKNWEKRTVNRDKTDIPDSIESVAENMIGSLMGDDTEPTVWTTREEIRNEFIVPEQDYVSVLKASDVVSASCKDSGKYHEIYIKLKDTKNPTAGVGVGSVCDVIETAEVAEKAGFVEEFSTQYYNCEVRMKIDKESGRVLHANYKTPLVLIMRVNLFGTHSGTIGFTFEKDYTITY